MELALVAKWGAAGEGREPSLGRLGRKAVRRLLERRRAAGEIRDDVDVELVGPISSALVHQRLLITFEPVDESLAEQIVDSLLLPLLT